MTTREFMEKVIATVNDVEMVEFAKGRIEAMDKANANKISKKNSKAMIENEPIIKAIREFMVGRDFTVASEIANGVSEMGIKVSTNKVIPLLKAMDDVIIGEAKSNGRKVKSFKIG